MVLEIARSSLLRSDVTCALLKAGFEITEHTNVFFDRHGYAIVLEEEGVDLESLISEPFLEGILSFNELDVRFGNVIYLLRRRQWPCSHDLISAQATHGLSVEEKVEEVVNVFRRLRGYGFTGTGHTSFRLRPAPAALLQPRVSLILISLPGCTGAYFEKR